MTFEDGRRSWRDRACADAGADGRDPLRVERQRPDQLRVTVPLAPRETVRVRLAFVTPLEGARAGTALHRPVAGDRAAERRETRPTTPREEPSLTPTPSFHVDDAPRRAGRLTYAEALPGMLAAPSAGSRLAFRPEHASYAGSRARVAFRAPEGPLPALAVRGGGLGTRVAVWRFDPTEFLAGHGLAGIGDDAVLRLTGSAGFTQRVVPGMVEASSPAIPMAARVLPGAEAVTYTVEVETRDGRNAACAEPLARADVEEIC